MEPESNTQPSDPQPQLEVQLVIIEPEEDEGTDYRSDAWDTYYADGRWRSEYRHRLPKDFTGTFLEFYGDGTVMDKIQVEAGKLHGSVKSYFPSGAIHTDFQYVHGELQGAHLEYWESGALMRKIIFSPGSPLRPTFLYHENGQLKELFHRNEELEYDGLYKKWYENGQLAEVSHYDPDSYFRTGHWQLYHKNGQQKLSAENQGEKEILHDFWQEDGEQLMHRGTGFCLRDWDLCGPRHEEEINFKNYKKQGLYRLILDNVLIWEQEYLADEFHGKVRFFYKNGRVKWESVYENGKHLSRKEFDRFEHPKLTTILQAGVSAEDVLVYQLPLADVYPHLTSPTEQAATFTPAPLGFSDPNDDRESSYSYKVEVSTAGTVTNFTFVGYTVPPNQTAINQHLRTLTFIPAKIGGKPVAGEAILTYIFTWVEGLDNS